LRHDFLLAGCLPDDLRSTTDNHSLTHDSRRFDCRQSSPPHKPALMVARGNHPAGVNVLCCDGHVQFVKDTVSRGTWRAPATRAGGEVVSADAL
jgi:prepilin-type processing-associated H-X9-DG protein